MIVVKTSPTGLVVPRPDITNILLRREYLIAVLRHLPTRNQRRYSKEQGRFVPLLSRRSSTKLDSAVAVVLGLPFLAHGLWHQRKTIDDIEKELKNLRIAPDGPQYKNPRENDIIDMENLDAVLR